ncbi:MAG: N-formylglutamate amidohydrolase [Methanosarcinales archaeon]|nr:N-formylglutamate amidohydrolase [Methanosarcinales archaeon]
MEQAFREWLISEGMGLPEDTEMVTHPLLISIPHGGNTVPPEVREMVCITGRDIFYDGDALTREIYGFGKRVDAVIETPIARAIVDVNRASDDRPPANPDGVVKTVTTDGTPVYRKGMFPDDALVEDLLQRYYFPYHETLGDLLSNRSIRLALDCHSMLERSPAASVRPGEPRPLICLSNRGDEHGMPARGRGPVTCPPEWIRALAESLGQAFAGGGRVAMNDPFAGRYISQYHYKRRGIPWMQMEINCKLYLNEVYFDPGRLRVDQRIIQELRGRIFDALVRFLTVL